jgi:kynurenine formamidase
MEVQEQEVRYVDHREFARRLAYMFGVQPQAIPVPGVHQSFEYVNLSSHAGTHVDAPSHYGPSKEGKIGRHIDEIPLEWCFAPGVKLDFSHIPPDVAIGVDDFKAELDRIGYTIRPLDIVMIRTGAECYIDDLKYREKGAGITAEACHWLLDQGVKVIGTDSVTLDQPHRIMAEKLNAGDTYAWFPVHYVGREREYLMIEKLNNLGRLPRPFGFKVAAFPVRIERGSGGWCRAVAIFDDD